MYNFDIHLSLSVFHDIVSSYFHLSPSRSPGPPSCPSACPAPRRWPRWQRRSCYLSGMSPLHCTALHCTALHCTALYWTALHCIALHCTVPTLHWTALHSTALHWTELNYNALYNTEYCTVYTAFYLGHKDIAIVAPVVGPWVLHQPVILIIYIQINK